jgi:hypothetical protein
MPRQLHLSGRPLIGAGVVLLALAVLLTAGDRPRTRLVRPAAGATTATTGAQLPARVPFGPGVAFGAASGPQNGSREASTLSLERALGRRLALHRIYRTWEPRLIPLVGWDLAGGRVPVLSVNPRRGRTPVRWWAIAGAREDAVIRAQARAAAALHARYCCPSATSRRTTETTAPQRTSPPGGATSPCSVPSTQQRAVRLDPDGVELPPARPPRPGRGVLPR